MPTLQRQRPLMNLAIWQRELQDVEVLAWPGGWLRMTSSNQLQLP